MRIAPDLRTAPYDKSRLKEISAKLHVFSPDVLPSRMLVDLLVADGEERESE